MIYTFLKRKNISKQILKKLRFNSELSLFEKLLCDQLFIGGIFMHGRLLTEVLIPVLY